MNFWLKIVAVLLAVWALAAGAIYLARSARPTAVSATRYLDKNPLPASGASRAKIIAKLEGMLNRISYEDRQQLERDGTTRGFFRQLTPDEQGAFLDATLPSGFKQMMDSFNAMDAGRRKQVVNRALAEMKKHEDEKRPDEGEKRPDVLNDKVAQRVVNEGLRSFYKDANADVKLDLAPLIEQMQKNLESGR